jgi:hypothetical protein
MSTDTLTLRYEGPASRYRFPAADIDVTPGDTVTIDADRDILTHVDEDDEEHYMPLCEFLVDRFDFERVSAAYTDVLDKSVPDLRDALATGAYDDRLDALAHAERAGENRTTALDAIEARQEGRTE